MENQELTMEKILKAVEGLQSQIEMKLIILKEFSIN